MIARITREGRVVSDHLPAVGDRIICDPFGEFVVREFYNTDKDNFIVLEADDGRSFTHRFTVEDS